MDFAWRRAVQYVLDEKGPPQFEQYIASALRAPAPHDGQKRACVVSIIRSVAGTGSAC